MTTFHTHVHAGKLWRLFFCEGCWRPNFFRRQHLLPAVLGAFVAGGAYDRSGRRVDIPERYSLICKCGMGHIAFLGKVPQ